MNKFNSNTTIIFAAFLIACGISVAGYFIGQTLFNSQVALNTAEVKGLAERKVEADSVYWSLQYTVSGYDQAEIPELYKKSESDQNTIINLLKKSGFDNNEIIPGIIDYFSEEFRNRNQELIAEKHFLVGEIEVQTKKVHKVAEVRSKLNKLISQGLDLKNNAPAYYFTKLNDIKPDMLKQATTNARIAANEFAANAGVKVGGIRTARQGGFIIKDVGQDYGDTQKINKNVRVVTTITFYLTD